MKKTIGIITFHKTINYGGVLQAYALQKILCDMGYVAEIIDYCPPKLRALGLSFVLQVRYFIWHYIVKRMLAGMDRQRKTDEFLQNHFQLSARKYFNAKTLHSNYLHYDAYITGSDQVWNPTINNHDSSYFLTFAPQGKKRISYAASFGVTQIQDKFVSNYQEWLKQIDRLSTRESEGVQIIKQLTGRDAEIVLDPTLLLDKEHWSRIAVPYVSPKPYILCYYMPGEIETNQSITKLANQVSTLTGWGIVCIGQKEYMRLNLRKHSIFDAGPAEFLGLIQDASFIVTNSFHGVAFSINFRKPFFVPIKNDLHPEKALSSRITTLLRTLKLEHRLLPLGEGLPSENIFNINYQKVEKILKEKRDLSIEFLKNSLNGT